MIVTLAQQILNSPYPVGDVGRTVRLMDKEPKQKTGQSHAAVLAAKEQAAAWVAIPCGKQMKPVQDVLRVLLEHIKELEGKRCS